MSEKYTCVCPSCQGPFEMQKSADTAFCPYCGNKFDLNEENATPFPSVSEEAQDPSSSAEESGKTETIRAARKRGNWKKNAIYAYVIIVLFLSWTTFLFFRFEAESRLMLLKAAILAVTLPLMGLFSWLYLRKVRRREQNEAETESEKTEGFFVKLTKRPLFKVVLAWIIYLALILLMFWLVPSTPKSANESSQNLPAAQEKTDQTPEKQKEAPNKPEESKPEAPEAEETKTAASEEPEETPAIQTVKLYIHVQSDLNLAFSTYDMEILYDGEVIGTVKNGEHFTKLVDAEAGKHEIIARNAENEETYSKKTIEVREDSTFRSLLKHDKSSISFTNTSTKAGIAEASLEMPNVEGQNLAVALESLKKIGFVNVDYESSGVILDANNWRVVQQDVAAGTVMDCNARIQLECISLDDFYSQQFTGKTVNEVLRLGKEMGITVKFENESWKDVTEEVNKMSEEEKNTWIATKARKEAFETSAIVTIKNPKAPTPTPEPTATPKPSATPKPTTTPKPSSTPKPDNLYYSTNNREKAKKGNSGVFAYCRRGSQVSNYYIIDFESGYVYWFSEGSGENTCDRLKIESGDLNSVLIITYHVEGETWSEGLHFKWKNIPDTLIVQDQDGFELEYKPTDLEKAIKLRDKLKIVDY